MVDRFGGKALHLFYSKSRSSVPHSSNRFQMKRTRLSPEKKLYGLDLLLAGSPVDDVVRQFKVSARFVEDSEIGRFRQLVLLYSRTNF